MKKIAIIGHYGEGENLVNGQTIKTKIVTNELEKYFGEIEVDRIDTHKKIINSIVKSVKSLINHRNIIMLPAHNGVRIFTPVLFLSNLIFRRSLHYIVIGGWLPDFLHNKRVLSWFLKRFDYIYVETNGMKLKMDGLGFSNVVVMPYCKDLNIIDCNELVYNCSDTVFKFCTFSRVMKEKGVEDAVEAIKILNSQDNNRNYYLYRSALPNNHHGWNKER